MDCWTSDKRMSGNVDYLKLVHINLHYRVLATSTTAIFLSNDHSLYIDLYTLDERGFLQTYLI